MTTMKPNIPASEICAAKWTARAVTRGQSTVSSSASCPYREREAAFAWMCIDGYDMPYDLIGPRRQWFDRDVQQGRILSIDLRVTLIDPGARYVEHFDTAESRLELLCEPDPYLGWRLRHPTPRRRNAAIGERMGKGGGERRDRDEHGNDAGKDFPAAHITLPRGAWSSSGRRSQSSREKSARRQSNAPRHACRVRATRAWRSTPYPQKYNGS